MDLTKIDSPAFLKDLTEEQLNSLGQDIRSFLIENISKTGGHLSSNLGVVELTIALHYVFDSPIDKIFFDVGHQSYVHKILTGRAKDFSTLRKTNGMSGFQKINESEHDVWEAGHSSTAISAAVAMAVSRDLDKQNYHVIPVVGDAAMVGGESLEALNHLGSINNKVIIVLNDNQMAIGKSVGSFGDFLADVRISRTYNHLKEDYRLLLSKGKVRRCILKGTKAIKNFVKRGVIKPTIFDDFGIEYLGPVDGHDIHDLLRVFHVAKNARGSVVVHVVTKKGKGYVHAENDVCGKWHGIGPFEIDTGKAKTKVDATVSSWSSIVSLHLESLMQKDEQIIAITPAMIHGSAMESLFNHFPSRCFDVGIAEEHAMTFVAGLAISNKKPFISIYSSFLQRAYDQINHDIARMNAPCFISIDRAGIVGSDGPTHHGVFDIGILTPIPNIIIFAPKDAQEAMDYMTMAFLDFSHPYVLRIPRADVKTVSNYQYTPMTIGTWTSIKKPEKPVITIICYGDNVNKIDALCLQHNIEAWIVNARFIKPMDCTMLDAIANNESPILVYETDLKCNGLASAISYYYSQNNIARQIHSIGIEDHYSMQGSIHDIYQEEQIDLDSVLLKIKEIIHD